jgi:hypothetical protein
MFPSDRVLLFLVQCSGSISSYKGDPASWRATLRAVTAFGIEMDQGDASECPPQVVTDETPSGHDRSAVECIATKTDRRSAEGVPLFPIEPLAELV